MTYQEFCDLYNLDPSKSSSQKQYDDYLKFEQKNNKLIKEAKEIPVKPSTSLFKFII